MFWVYCSQLVACDTHSVIQSSMLTAHCECFHWSCVIVQHHTLLQFNLLLQLNQNWRLHTIPEQITRFISIDVSNSLSSR